MSGKKKKDILCVGACVLDIIHVCRDFPIEDTKYHCKTGYWQRGGNASNSCTVLRLLGADVEFLGMISSSAAFSFLYEDCVKREIDIRNCPTTSKDPAFSSIMLVESTGTRTIVHSIPDFPILRAKHFRKIDLSLYTWIHFEGCNPEETRDMLDMIYTYNNTAKESIIVSVELEKQESSLFTLCTTANVVFVGKDMAIHQGWSTAKEAVYKARMLITEMQTIENIGRNLIWPTPCVVCPWGEERADCFSSKDEYASYPGIQVGNVVDTLGAGDTFVAGFIYGMHTMKLTELEAVNFANHLAAYKIQYRGYDKLANFEQKKY